MTDTPRRTVEAFQQLAQKLRDELPELGELFGKYEAGETTIDDVLMEGSALLQERPDLMKLLEPVELEEKDIMIAQGENALQTIPRTSEKTLAELGLTPDDLLYLDDEDKVRVNPLYLSAIAERAQFDGDVPELRFGGDMPKGATPAVPVETDAASPVALGAMLETAEGDVAGEMQDLVERRQRAADEALVELASTSLDGDQDATALVLDKARSAALDLHRPVNVEGYERGRVPAKRVVDAPTGAELAAMSPERRQQLAWKAISTTQGRRSAAPVVARIVEDKFQEAAFSVRYVDGWTERLKVASAVWTTSLGDGPSSTNPAFMPVGLSAHALSMKMVKELRESNVGQDLDLELEVSAVNDIGRRQVGWRAQVVLPKTVPQIGEVSA